MLPSSFSSSSVSSASSQTAGLACCTNESIEKDESLRTWVRLTPYTVVGTVRAICSSFSGLLSLILCPMSLLRGTGNSNG